MKIHFIAIGGAIMHQLAISLKNMNYQVSGSDDEITDPAKTNLQKANILPEIEGWFPERITADLDAVILGMHARADNPELIKAQALGLKIYSFPEYIYEVSKDKKRIVVAGSHGKTTTTSMIMHVLKDQKMAFDYLVGAKIEGFNYSVQISDAPIIILEGDEYPASTLNLKPKIFFYHPHISVLTGVAWDHVNVFPTFENYKEQFAYYLSHIDKGGTIIYNQEDKNVDELVEHNTAHLTRIPYHTPKFWVENGQLFVNDGAGGSVALEIFGSHNLQNMEAARIVCNQLGIEKDVFFKSIATFSGAAKRLEKIEETDKYVVFRDFAHAPSKLAATVKAAKERFADRKIIGVFELHTYSSLTDSFLSQYAHSMDSLDYAAVYFSEHALAIKHLPELDTALVKDHFKNQKLQVFHNRVQLENWLHESIDAVKNQPACLLFMSSGTFDGMEFKGWFN